MTLHHLLTLSSFLALLVMPCPSSHVGEGEEASILASFPMQEQAQCISMCSANETCNWPLFDKQNNICYILKCSNITICGEISVQDLLSHQEASNQRHSATKNPEITNSRDTSSSCHCHNQCDKHHANNSTNSSHHTHKPIHSNHPSHNTIDSDDKKGINYCFGNHHGQRCVIAN
ncbi:hypothetical protein MATL_G00099330 [Megalops atlanticus]|uniref:Apple domain-containing protein n=1 Tax=Megalops atlanticus TaxID=7932 RepID=A0A9D3Q6N7_MEGAT|nr:hypothetical protein MATL_G00099330 [Megalops atlanticus]